MKLEKLKTLNIKELAEDWGLDYQVFKIKQELVDAINNICRQENITPVKLASMVDGLTQDQASKLLSGKVSHITINKMVEILSSPQIKTDVNTKKYLESY